jgi:amino-acid N-acetyltransferase
MPTVELRAADGDLSYVEDLLADAGLPADDVREKPGAFYRGVADGGPDDEDEHAGRQVGVGGIEQYGSTGLLRSVVVEPDLRGAGYGQTLCDALEARARADGIESLSLLTTTAAAFFEARGYERVARSAAPAPIRETTQFTELCPDSAVCLRKSLGDGAFD